MTRSRKPSKIAIPLKHIPATLETLDFCVLEEAAGVKFDEEQRDWILVFTKQYPAASTTWTHAPGNAVVKKRLEEIAKRAEKLTEVLHERDHSGHIAKSLYWAFDESPTDVLLFLAELSGRARAAADRISVNRGHPGNSPLDQLIEGIYFFWQKAGGKGKGYYWDPYAKSGSGPFLSLLQLILEQIGEHQDAKALLKAIKSALRSA